MNSIDLIIIGDEILNGRTVDTNSQWLAKFLYTQNYNLGKIHIIRDSNETIKETLNAAFLNSNIVITSGGLGPTEDDMTKKSFADFFNLEIENSKEAMTVVQNNYHLGNLIWHKEFNHYDMIPKNFFPINNPAGFAPGLGYLFNQNKKILLAAPGVPKEFKQMVEKEFLPILKINKLLDKNETELTTIRTFGIPEEKIFGELCPTLWKDLESFGKVSSLPHVSGIDILIHTEGNKRDLIISFLKETRLFSYIWNFDSRSLPEVIIEEAKNKQLKVSLSESCTGGLVASLLTDVAGCSSVFLGSAVTYSNASKEHLVHVSHQTLVSYGAVSEEVAKEMATGSLKSFGSDLAISLTGIAGPDGGTDYKPVGTVCIGIATKTISESKKYKFTGDREKLKSRFAYAGMMELLKLIRKI